MNHEPQLDPILSFPMSPQLPVWLPAKLHPHAVGVQSLGAPRTLGFSPGGVPRGPTASTLFGLVQGLAQGRPGNFCLFRIEVDNMVLEQLAS